MLRAAIFDMDGLLIDSEPFWRQSHIEALREHDVVITHDDVRAMAGKRTDAVVKHWRHKYDLQHIPNEVLEATVVKKVMEHITQNGQALAGAHGLLQELQAQKIPIAIASSSAPEIIEAVINKLKINSYIKLAYSAKQEEFGKPHPGVFLTTVQKLGVEPGNCVVFEDSASGVVAAKTAGMKCVAVPESVNLQDETIRQADMVLTSLEEAHYAVLTALWG